jgi:hypothetical protein
MRGIVGIFLFLLRKCTKACFSGVKEASCISPHTAPVNLILGCICLFSALAKCPNIHIINKTIGRCGQVRGVAKVSQFSIVEEEVNR